MALYLAACSTLFARRWIVVELPWMSSSVVPDEGCVIACVPGFLVLNDHEPVYDYWPLSELRKGLHRSRLEPDASQPDSCVHLRPTTAWVPHASAAIASAMEPPESPCLLPAL